MCLSFNQLLLSNMSLSACFNCNAPNHQLARVDLCRAVGFMKVISSSESELMTVRSQAEAIWSESESTIYDFLFNSLEFLWFLRLFL